MNFFKRRKKITKGQQELTCFMRVATGLNQSNDPAAIDELENLQKMVIRRLQSKAMLNAYLVEDNCAWRSIESEDLHPEGLSMDKYRSICAGGSISLSSEPVIPFPWNPNGLIKNLGRIGKNLPAGEFKATSNHRVDYYWPLMMPVVIGGNHTIAQGIIRGEGQVPLNHIYDVTPLVKQYSFDGDCWVRLSDKRKLGMPRFVEIGLAWELGRLIMEKNHQPYNVIPK